MTFWHKNLAQSTDDDRAERIIQKKRSKQNRAAKGLGAVVVPRSGPRAVHQRNEDRHILQGKSAVATIGGKDHEVSLLNLSSNGVMIACEEMVEIGEEIGLAIEDCSPITTAARWVRSGRIGLEFIAETEIIADAGVRDYIIKAIRREAEETGYNASLTVGNERRDVAKRHQLVWVGKLKTDAGEYTARLRNLSSSGAMISLSSPPETDEGSQVVLALVNAGPVAGRVRWSAGQEMGIQFDEPFDVALLVNECCAELSSDTDANGLGQEHGEEGQPLSDFEKLRVRHGAIANPHCPPDMEYSKLSLDELYSTLYPEGRPEGDGTLATPPDKVEADDSDEDAPPSHSAA